MGVVTPNFREFRTHKLVSLFPATMYTAQTLIGCMLCQLARLGTLAETLILITIIVGVSGGVAHPGFWNLKVGN
jgi:hypothetical protein